MPTASTASRSSAISRCRRRVCVPLRERPPLRFERPAAPLLDRGSVVGNGSGTTYGLLSSSGIGGLGVLVGLGFYLPFNIVLTYTIGTLMRVFADWRVGKLWSEDVGVPVAAGLIVGEALVGVVYSLYIVFG